MALFAELKKKGKERKEQLFKVELDNLDINKTSSTGKLLAITSNKRFKNVKKITTKRETKKISTQLNRTGLRTVSFTVQRD